MSSHKDSYTADDLVDVLNRVQASAQPIDMASGDDDARIPAALWREFVDAHAALLRERAQRTALNPAAAWPFPQDRAVRAAAELTVENEALRKALRALIAAEHEFVKDTEIALEDEVADAVKAAELVLQKYRRVTATREG